MADCDGNSKKFLRVICTLPDVIIRVTNVDSEETVDYECNRTLLASSCEKLRNMLNRTTVDENGTHVLEIETLEDHDAYKAMLNFCHTGKVDLTHLKPYPRFIWFSVIHDAYVLASEYEPKNFATELFQSMESCIARTFIGSNKTKKINMIKEHSRLRERNIFACRETLECLAQYLVEKEPDLIRSTEFQDLFNDLPELAKEMFSASLKKSNKLQG